MVETVKIDETVEANEIAEIAKTVKVVETARAGKDGKKIEDGKYLKSLVQIPCMQYPITFRKKSVLILVLLDSGNKVNAIHPTFA